MTNPETTGSDAGLVYPFRKSRGLPGIGRRNDVRAPTARASGRAKADVFVSVIVPVHDVPGSLLRSCLTSLSQQTLRPDEFEIVVVDDFSTSGATLEELDRFLNTHPGAKLVRHEKNMGLNEARRSGVSASRGNYIVFVDGDDLLTRDGLESLRIEAANKRAEIVTAPFYRWSSDNYTYSDVPITSEPFPSDRIERLRSLLSGQNSFTMCGRLFRRNIFDDELLRLPIGQLHEDVATLVRAIFKAKTVAHVQKPIYFYTINPGSITKNFTRKHAAGMIDSLKVWIECAQNAGLLDELAPQMALGIEKMLNVCVERCAFSAGMTDANKIDVLSFIQTECDTLPVRVTAPTLPGMKLLLATPASELWRQPDMLAESLAKFYPKGPPSHMKAQAPLKKGLAPSEMALRLRGKIVFIAQVDYHVRSAAALARALRDLGHPCVVLDNSAVVAKGKRKFTPLISDSFTGIECIQVEEPTYGPDWLATSKLVVTFNDYNNETQEALEYRHRLGLPTICMVEGINDFLRVDFADYRNLPYRRCDYVFLAGEDDEQYFRDRETRVIGLPIIGSLSKKSPAFPRTPLAVLNVNFTYGALEDCRDDFVAAAKEAFEAAGIDWVITKHPMDKGETAGLPVSPKTQYELIDECTVFVSRFATGILEALASGKPVIYFNPHGELVEKYKSPMGAYEIATTSEELAEAVRRTLAEVAAGVDFRARALPFLHRHTAYAPDGPGVVERFSAAVREIIRETKPKNRIVSDLLIDRLSRDKTADAAAKLDFLQREVALLWDEIGEAARDLAASGKAQAASQAALHADIQRRFDALGAEYRQREEALRREMANEINVLQRRLEQGEKSLEQSEAAVRAELQERVEALRGDLAQGVEQNRRELDELAVATARREGALREELRESVRAAIQKTEEVRAASEQRAEALQVMAREQALSAGQRFDKIEAASEQSARALRDKMDQADRASRAAAADLKAAAAQREEAMLARLAHLSETTQQKLVALESELASKHASVRAEMKASIEHATQSTLDQSEQERVKDRALMRRLRERVAAGERQIGVLRHGDTPKTLVFFGHHKCASRFFRNEVFATIAEATRARVRKYKITDPPFHYSMSDELDLVNIDFSGLGENGSDVVLFSNATARSLEKLNQATSDWRGIRILRDPRQVLVSDYFHHKGEHPSELGGWIWDQLAKDKPILRKLPEEEGLLYELDSISKQIIETQIVARFDDPRIMTFKIEDFSRDPRGHLERMSEFLGVADIAGIDLTRTMANPESGPWRRHFTSKLREVFKERYGQALIDLGYAEDLYW